jgi:hypothetical protein
MHPTDRTARVAGALYVLMGLVAPFSLAYVPGKLIVPGDAAQTADKILGAEMLFRLGMVGELVGAVVFVLLAMALYQLLSPVNRNYARLMVSLVLVSVAITFATVLNSIAALTFSVTPGRTTSRRSTTLSGRPSACCFSLCGPRDIS